MNEHAKTEQTFDNENRLTQETTGGRSTQHEYDAMGNQTRRVSALGNEIRYDYDIMGRAATVAINGAEMAITRNELGLPVKEVTGGAVRNLLICIATHFLWLFEKYNFRIVDSSFDHSFGGQAQITLKNNKIIVCLVSDRDRIYIEFSPLKGWGVQNGVTLDLIYQYILGKSIDTTMITDETIRFLKDHFDSIVKLFCNNDTEKIKSIFSKLKKERAKRLFG